MTFRVEEARELLIAADVFFGETEDEDSKFAQMLDMNDTWSWASADGEYVPDEDLPEVARLFSKYGWCGLLYWTSERRDQMRSEFADVNRFVEFVRAEEAICREECNDSKRAYLKREYMLGAPA